MFVRVLFLAFLLTMSVYSQTPPVEAGVSQTLAKWRAARYSDVSYKLNITLEKGATVLKGAMEIRVKVGEPGSKKVGENAGSFQILDAMPSIILDWRKLRGKENLSTVSNVSINGRLLILNPDAGKFDFVTDGREEQNYFEFNEHLAFQDGVKIGENVIKLDFTSPVSTSGAAITRYVDKEDGAEYVYSLFVPSDASTAFPVFDQPDLKAKFSLTLTMPEGWKAVSNTNSLSNPRATQFGGRRIRTLNLVNFEETKPISTYVFAFAAGDFLEVEEADLADEEWRKEGGSAASKTFTKLLKKDSKDNPPAENTPKIYLRKSQYKKFIQFGMEVFRLNREGVKYLESYFDFKYPFGKYDLVLIPEFPFGGMEHAGATFLRESSVIFPSEPTANDFISRANLIFHEAAHQWFGDTVTMKWFDDLWLKEGFAEFMAYKTLEKTMPEYNAWKAFYERNKPLAYLTDSTKGTTPIYQEIPNLSAAKSAYGNIVYRKAPSFLRQAEFYLGEDKFQTAVRAFLKKYQFKNAEWKDLVTEFNKVYDRRGLPEWAEYWVKQKGVPIIKVSITEGHYEESQVSNGNWSSSAWMVPALGLTLSEPFEDSPWALSIKTLYRYGQESEITTNHVSGNPYTDYLPRLFDKNRKYDDKHPLPDLIFPNYQDYGYGIFLLDEKSREYVLKNIQNEKDDFLRSMMWGTLWDSVREAELAPKTYIELAIKNISVETDELTIQTILSRVSTAMNYYLSDTQAKKLAPQLENLLISKLTTAKTKGQRITFYRAFLNIASTEMGATSLKNVLELNMKASKEEIEKAKASPGIKENCAICLEIPVLSAKDKFDIVTKLAILGDADAPKLLADLQKTEAGDDAKRYAYAAGAAFPTKEAKEKYFNDFLNNKEISESWIESAFAPFNSARHAELTLPYLEKALAELPNLKRNRKIFFVNGWLAAFIGGQKDEKALAIINKFLADNPNLDGDLRLKILENVDVIERAVKIRKKWIMDNG